MAQRITEGSRIRWPAERTRIASEYFPMSGGMILVDAWHPIPAHPILGILDTIRNRLLDFILELEKREPAVFRESASEFVPNPANIDKVFNVTIAAGIGRVGQEQQLRVSGDSYQVEQAGIVGNRGRIENPRVEQIYSKTVPQIDLEALALELGELRALLKKESTTVEEDIALGRAASAQKAAEAGEQSEALGHLKKAGRWLLEVAEKMSLSVTQAAIKAALGL
jgi:hypothetical protein